MLKLTRSFDPGLPLETSSGVRPWRLPCTFHLSCIRSKDAMVRPPVPNYRQCPLSGTRLGNRRDCCNRAHIKSRQRCNRPPPTTGEIGGDPNPRYFATFPGIRYFATFPRIMSGFSDVQYEHNDIYLTTSMVIAERSRFVLGACTKK